MLLQSSSRLTNNNSKTSAKLLMLWFSNACQRSSSQQSLLLPLSSCIPPSSFQSSSSIHTTAINQAEPLKKKKAINPLTTKKQFERKVRRLEREINRLESIPLKLKPILELQLPPHVVRNLNQYQRSNEQNADDVENVNKLLKQYYKIWSIYKGLETREEMKCIRQVVESQEQAMNLLKKEYPNLYAKAIEIDPDLIPYRIDNVKKNTPPNDQYQCPDGKETDITKEWKL